MKKEKVANRDLTGVPLESSLGHLAYGDIAFLAWREKKKAINSTLNPKRKDPEDD